MAQWLIIHGRAAGKLLAPDGLCRARDGRAPLQHPQPGPWLPARLARGACALRSLVAKAARRAPSMVASAGAVRIARGAATPQPGQGWGAAHAAIGCRSLNGPQRGQS
jgi:hypothetical protein